MLKKASNADYKNANNSNTDLNSIELEVFEKENRKENDNKVLSALPLFLFRVSSAGAN